MLRFVFLLFVSIFLLNCSRAPAIPIISTPPIQAAQRHIKLPDFNEVIVQGNVNVNLHTGFNTPEVILSGLPQDLAQVKAAVRNHRLYISLGAGYPHGSLLIDIHAKHLNFFAFKGVGEVTGTKLHSSLLDLVIANKSRTTLGGDIALRNVRIIGPGFTQLIGVRGEHMNLKLIGKPRVQISGMVNLTDLDLSKGSWLSLYWVKTNRIVIRAKDNTFLQLAGTTDLLDVELCGHARFNGKYLRASRAFVKTHDQAVAEISAVNRQHTLASGASNIYFYNIPQMRADFMAFSGSVLDMRDWNDPWMQEYNRYNK